MTHAWQWTLSTIIITSSCKTNDKLKTKMKRKWNATMKRKRKMAMKRKRTMKRKRYMSSKNLYHQSLGGVQGP